MALPAGVSTAVVTVGVPVTFTGNTVKTNITITPSAFLVHTATGHPLVNMIEEATANDGVAVQFTLPHTDQAGFQDEAGNAYQNWYYTATIQYQQGKVTKPAFTKVFQLAVGQTTVDLDLLPSGSPAMPYTAPVATVTSVAGKTGAVTIEDADLPTRLSATSLNATYAPVSGSTNYAAISDVKARSHLVIGAANSATDFTTLQAAVNSAATAGAPLIVRGNFTLTGGTVTPTGEVHIDARHAVFTQTDNLRATFSLPAKSSITGGKIIGKGTDWQNTSAVYQAAGVQVTGNDVTVQNVTVENMAGSGVYVPAAGNIGLKVLDCYLTGVGGGIIPVSTGQYSGGVVFGNNGVSGFTLRGGWYKDFAQGVVTGSVSDCFIGGGLELSSVGQHGLYLGAIDSGTISGVRVNTVPLQGVKVQVTNAGAIDSDLVTIGDVTVRNCGSHGVLVTNVDAVPTSFNRKVAIHDVTVEHAAGGTGDGVVLLAVSNATVHDVVSVGGWRGFRATECSQLNIHHNSFSGGTKSGIHMTNVTDSDINFNVVRNMATANDATDEFGVYVLGANSADLRFSHNRIFDASANMKYGFYLSAGTLTSMSLSNNSSNGMSDYGYRAAASDATKIWIGNDLQGNIGRFFNIPTNAAAIADTSGAALAALETEVNKLKARLRLVGTINP